MQGHTTLTLESTTGQPLTKIHINARQIGMLLGSSYDWDPLKPMFSSALRAVKW